MDLQISGKQMWTGSGPQIALQIALSSSNEGKQTATTHNSVDENTLMWKNKTKQNKKTYPKISPGKFTSLKCPFQVLFNIILSVLVEYEVKENKVSYGC